MALSLIPSSSSNIPKFKHDVFLSFRGEDTRYNFISHLHKALCDKQILTFIDDKLNRGDEISPSLLEAIEESQISIIIFSQNYANSRWCLDELVKILECKICFQQIVIPVFYNVLPTDVRNQTGSFGDAFRKHEECFKENQVQKWKDALKKASNLSGWHLDTNKRESVLIQDIVEDVLRRLNDVPQSDNNDLVGIDSRIEQIQSLLERGSVGIWGIGGIGKTTLAGALFDKISWQFEGFYFADSVRETSKQDNGLNRLRQGLLSKLLGDENAHLGTFTKRRLGRKNLLIVFDDVTNFEQIESLIGDPSYLGSESRIIVTSRDSQVLKNCRVDHIYEVKELSFDDALKLFSMHAFRQSHPKVNYNELSKSVVQKVGCVPLAIKVLGSSLFDKGNDVWESAMKRLEKNFDKNIHKVLKISYDELDDNEQGIFLDIACFFKREHVTLVEEFMDACGFFTKIGISALIDKSLITISYNELNMHDLVQAMGKEIVRQQSINDPGKCSRLWHHKDIDDILTKATGTKTIEGISLDMLKTRDIYLHPRAFEKMRKLRLLRFYFSDYSKNNKNKVHVLQGLEPIFPELKYLYWYGCPFKSLQSKFSSQNLVILKMPNTDLKELWSGVQQFDNLKRIDLSFSQHLVSCPDLSGSPNLEKLILTGCTSLIEIPSSFSHLTQLECLSLVDCQNLTSIPDCSGCKSLKHLSLANCSKAKRLPETPNSLEILDITSCFSIIANYKLTELIMLNTCNCRGYLNLFDHYYLIDWPNDKLSVLCLGGWSSLVEFPSSFKHLDKLNCLEFIDCKNLTNIPDLGGLKSLAQLTIKSCPRLELLPELPNSIRRLRLEDIPIEELPPSCKDLCRLLLLHIDNCSSLKSLPSSVSMWKSLERLFLRNCSKIDKLPEDFSCYLPPLIGLVNLRHLRLNSWEMIEIPETLFRLTSLESLHLQRNNFESIPESIINLSNLKKLDISYCKRLKVLPKLPWAHIIAINCTSLEELSCPSFPNDFFALSGGMAYGCFSFNLGNCYKLDQNSVNNFQKHALLNIQGLAASLAKNYYHQVDKVVPPPLSICYPAGEIPKWFNWQNEGSFIDVNLPLHCINHNFLCFALCVFGKVPTLKCDKKVIHVCYECNVKYKDGYHKSVGNPHCFREFQNVNVKYKGGYHKLVTNPNNYNVIPRFKPHNMSSSHVIIGFGFHFLRELGDNQIGLNFGSGKDCFKVEKCGIHLMFSQHLER